MIKKPFNLEEVLAGKPVVNGIGDRVFVTKLAHPRSRGFDLVVQDRDGVIMSFNLADGSAPGNPARSLYMLHEPKTVWVNLHPERGSYAEYDTEEAADKYTYTRRLGGKAHPITY